MKLANDLQYACDSAGWFWDLNNINKFASIDDSKAVSMKINKKEHTTFSDRKDYTNYLKNIFDYENCKHKNSIIILILTFLVSCQPKVNKIDRNSIPITENIIKSSTEKYDYSKIDLKEGFSGKLIDELPVRELDTVLFREWEVSNSQFKSIFLISNESKFRIQNSEFIIYYKTGKTKFSKYKLSLENTATKKIINFYTYINYNDDRDPYDNNKTSSFVELEKLNDTLGRFKVLDGSALGNFIYFKIKDDNLIITKLEIIPRTQIKQYSFVVDTIITINNKNNLIDIGKLNTITINEKNIKK